MRAEALAQATPEYQNGNAARKRGEPDRQTVHHDIGARRGKRNPDHKRIDRRCDRLEEDGGERKLGGRARLGSRSSRTAR